MPSVSAPLRAALLFLLLFPATGLAQRAARDLQPTRHDLPPLGTPPPRLITGPPTLVVTDGAFQKALSITSLDVEARIVGHLAETTMTMTFHNPSSRVLEGDLTFPLPPAATVSGYGLDVDGVLVDGVVVPKQEARRIFEAEVRKGVDPGLVEEVEGAAFRTRVFPIPARGTRTVRVSWVDTVNTRDPNAPRYHLPLGFTEPIDDVHVRVDVVRPATAPRVEGEGIEGFGFERWEDRQVAETRLKKALLDHTVAIVLPSLVTSPVAVERDPEGRVWFSVHHVERAPSSATRIDPDRVGLLWDASLSRLDADRERDIAVLTAWAATLTSPTRIELVAFSDRARGVESFTLPKETKALAEHLRNVVIDGGTSLAALEEASNDLKVDLFLLFSDGIANLGDTEPPTLSAPTWVFNGAAVANHDVLRALALSSGGAWLDLGATPVNDAVNAIGRAPFAFRGATGTGFTEAYPQIAEPVDGPFALAGRLVGDEATVRLRFAGPGAEPVEETFAVRASEATEGTLLRRFWAGKKVDDLAVGGKRNAEAIARVGIDNGIVTAGTSLLVLERYEQYVEYEVRPPAQLASMRTRWDQEMARRAKEEKAVATSKLERILSLWEERVAWWEKEFDLSPPKVITGGKGGESYGVGGLGARGTGEGGGGQAADGALMDDAYESEAMATLDAPMEEAPRRARQDADAARPSPTLKKEKKESGGPEAAPPPSVALKPWDPATPYLAALKEAPAAQWEEIYLRERATWGTAPAYFLDCSDFFAQRGQAKVARRVLSNLVELELEDPALLRVYARRLVQIDELDLAISTFERVAELRPDEPQSHRDLALALAARADGRRGDDPNGAFADYQRALDLLAKVVMDEWERFAEIELIALVEFNDVLVRAREVGDVVVPLDERLVKQLDMDVRIVMSWDADSTDMDLHVLEPSGEEAYYSHNRTRIGGRVSRDFTQGYGPEEYTIRRAMKGTYTVRTKFFGSSAAQLQGAVTLTVDVFTNYGRPNQTHDAVTIRLAESKETFTVAEIAFEGGKPVLKATRD